MICSACGFIAGSKECNDAWDRDIDRTYREGPTMSSITADELQLQLESLRDELLYDQKNDDLSGRRTYARAWVTSTGALVQLQASIRALDEPTPKEL